MSIVNTKISVTGSLIYPHLTRPDVRFNADGEYKLTLKVGKQDASEMLKEFDKALEASLADAEKKVKGKKVMLDTSPRVVLVQNVGMFSVGKDLNGARIAGDLTETNAKVIGSVEETSTYKFIPEKDLFDVEYWSLEQAKIKRKKKLLEGNVVVITGSTGTIGFETYKIFKSYGAEVVLLDYNLERLKEVQSKINDLCVHCDVTNKKSVKDAFKQICEKYGGIDILVSNAGTAPSGSIGEVSDDVLRKSFEVNFFSHQNCASEAVKIGQGGWYCLSPWTHEDSGF